MQCSSDIKALAAATRPFDVGIVEDELTRELRLYKIHLCAQQGQLSLLLYKNTNT